METQGNNQYIDLVSTKPGYILPCLEGSLAAQDKDEILARARAYSLVFCELGSGSGMHLIERAKRNPQAFFIGFELRYKRTYRSAVKAERENLSNILFVRSDARQLASIFPEHSLTGIYLNFPDPWDKRRWHKNRLFNADFVSTIHHLLKPDGFISYKTDHEGYFDDAIELVKSSPQLHIAKLSRDLHQSGYKEENIITEFEHLFLSKGQAIFFTEIKKTW